MLKAGPYWEIDGDGLDPGLFFRALPDSFPDATTLFAEGTSIADDVLRCLERHYEPGAFLPGANTIRPVSTKVAAASVARSRRSLRASLPCMPYRR